MKAGSVYFAKMVTGPIKIGFTTNLQHRTKNLSMGVPGGVTIIASMNATPGAESWLHRLFSAHRISGEWFAPADELTAFIERVGQVGNLAVPSEFRIEGTELPAKRLEEDEVSERVRFYLRKISEPVAAGEKVADLIKRAARIVGSSGTRTKDIWYGGARQITASEYVAIKEAFDIKIAATTRTGAQELEVMFDRDA